MYVDYDFYKSNYQGTMDETNFNKHEPRAEAYIRYFLFSKAYILDSSPIPGIQMAICAVTDTIGDHFTAKASRTVCGGSGAIVKSENNDGYSVSYAIEQKDGETEEVYLRKKAYDTAYLYLLPIGVLSRKVGCYCDHECGCDYL